MSAVALMPVRARDRWRGAALTYVRAWWERNFADVPVVFGSCSGEWSKGEAVAAARQLAADLAPTVLVIADADSTIARPEDLRAALEGVSSGRHPWIVPHSWVYRLREAETERLHANPEARPRLGHTCRPVYQGIPGGGITVLTADAFDTIGGIDRRFLGWGGEDVAFGYALETLVAPVHRLEGRLVHLWHPPETSNLRGSETSERLVGHYTAANGFPRRMRHVIATGEHPQPLPALAEPVRFRMRQPNNLRLKIGGTWFGPFTKGTYATDDPDHVEALRRDRRVTEIR